MSQIGMLLRPGQSSRYIEPVYTKHHNAPLLLEFLADLPITIMAIGRDDRSTIHTAQATGKSINV